MTTTRLRVWRVDEVPYGEWSSFLVTAREEDTGRRVQLSTRNAFQASLCREAKGPIDVTWVPRGPWKNIVTVDLVKEQTDVA